MKNRAVLPEELGSDCRSKAALLVVVTLSVVYTTARGIRAVVRSLTH